MGDVSEVTEKRHASRRIAGELRARIEADAYKPGETLPSYRQLAQEYGVAVNTAMAAVRILRDQGLVTIRPNARPSVKDRSVPVDAGAELHVIRADVADLRAEINSARGRLVNLEERLTVLADRLASDGE